MSWLTEAHGMVVHFPIALLFATVALELAALHPKLRAGLRPAALVTLVLGALGAVVSVMTGPDQNASGVTQLVHTHEQMADLTMIIFGALALWRLWLLWQRRPLTRGLVAVYLVVACIGLGALTYAGWLGGKMVYTEAVGVQRGGVPVAPPQPFQRGRTPGATAP